jgi:molybdopterin/thiamine biosynthesis adenylyltransferase
MTSEGGAGCESVLRCVGSEKQDRYSRLRVIPWWDQDTLRRAKVLVVGAGALGNEIIKNLALLGVGQVLIIDFDVVEESNLSRSVLYLSSDEHKPKANVARDAAAKLNPDCRFYALNADVRSQVGLGLYRWADVVICGLDNREARLAVNRACWRVNTPWVDGATESFQGIVSVFEPPDGVCYECTLGEQDREALNARNSCGFIARTAANQGGVPTTPTTASIVAGIQVQEAIKLLHTGNELGTLVNRGFFFDGISYDCFTVEYTRRDDCVSHETLGDVVRTELDSRNATLRDVIAIAEEGLGGTAQIDMPCEMVTALGCRECGTSRAERRLIWSIAADEATCPRCGRVMVPEVAYECTINSEFASTPLAELGFGLMDILTARSDKSEMHIEISGDAAGVFVDHN